MPAAFHLTIGDQTYTYTPDAGGRLKGYAITEPQADYLRPSLLRKTATVTLDNRLDGISPSLAVLYAMGRRIKNAACHLVMDTAFIVGRVTSISALNLESVTIAVEEDFGPLKTRLPPAIDALLPGTLPVYTQRDCLPVVFGEARRVPLRRLAGTRGRLLWVKVAKATRLNAGLNTLTTTIKLPAPLTLLTNAFSYQVVNLTDHPASVQLLPTQVAPARPLPARTDEGLDLTTPRTERATQVNWTLNDAWLAEIQNLTLTLRLQLSAPLDLAENDAVFEFFLYDLDIGGSPHVLAIPDDPAQALSVAGLQLASEQAAQGLAILGYSPYGSTSIFEGRSLYLDGRNLGTELPAPQKHAPTSIEVTRLPAEVAQAREDTPLHADLRTFGFEATGWRDSTSAGRPTPAHLVRFLLEDSAIGLGQAIIDQASFSSAIAWYTAQGIFVDGAITEQAPAADLLAHFLFIGRARLERTMHSIVYRIDREAIELDTLRLGLGDLDQNFTLDQFLPRFEEQATELTLNGTLDPGFRRNHTYLSDTTHGDDPTSPETLDMPYIAALDSLDKLAYYLYQNLQAQDLEIAGVVSLEAGWTPPAAGMLHTAIFLAIPQFAQRLNRFQIAAITHRAGKLDLRLRTWNPDLYNYKPGTRQTPPPLQLPDFSQTRPEAPTELTAKSIKEAEPGGAQSITFRISAKTPERNATHMIFRIVFTGKQASRGEIRFAVQPGKTYIRDIPAPTPNLQYDVLAWCENISNIPGRQVGIVASISVQAGAVHPALRVAQSGIPIVGQKVSVFIYGGVPPYRNVWEYYDASGTRRALSDRGTEISLTSAMVYGRVTHTAYDSAQPINQKVTTSWEDIQPPRLLDVWRVYAAHDEAFSGADLRSGTRTPSTSGTLNLAPGGNAIFIATPSGKSIQSILLGFAFSAVEALSDFSKQSRGPIRLMGNASFSYDYDIYKYTGSIDINRILRVNVY